MKSSRRDLFIDMVVDRFISKKDQMTLFTCFIFIPKTGVGQPKTWVSFKCACSGLTIRRCWRNGILKIVKSKIQNFHDRNRFQINIIQICKVILILSCEFTD